MKRKNWDKDRNQLKKKKILSFKNNKKEFKRKAMMIVVKNNQKDALKMTKLNLLTSKIYYIEQKYQIRDFISRLIGKKEKMVKNPYQLGKQMMM